MSEQVFVNLGHSGGTFFVHVRDGKITRVRPLVFSNDEEVPTWTIKADGREFSAPHRVTLAPFHHTERARTYCDDRILSPLKRTSFDPRGDRRPERRGKDGFEKISWEGSAGYSCLGNERDITWYRYPSLINLHPR